MVESLGSSPTRAESDAMVDRFTAEMDREGWGLWAVEVVGGARLRRHGRPAPGARGAPVRTGRRGGLAPPSRPWGHGYATEAAAASLDFGFDQGGLAEIVAFTTDVNTRSQAVMAAHRHDA